MEKPRLLVTYPGDNGPALFELDGHYLHGVISVETRMSVDAPSTIALELSGGFAIQKAQPVAPRRPGVIPPPGHRPETEMQVAVRAPFPTSAPVLMDRDGMDVSALRSCTRGSLRTYTYRGYF